MQSEKVWNVVEFGWSPPKVLDRERRPTNVIKPKLEWDRGDNEASENNARAMYSIFMPLAQMNSDGDHENFGEFHSKLVDIVNSSFNLGEPIPNSKVVRKILRSLPGRFRAKVTAIEESKDVDSLKVDELVSSLQTFEMTLGSLRKSKGIALNSIKEESLCSESEDDEKMSKSELTKFAKNSRST
ncbi:hypothetical protein CK203_093944 [Vitis vinifera]|uniref:Gag-pol polyprotein n=1 Tax=Vitis vinifera TaxID=29760 RepID=A0A438CKD0_VITVI|nr:hypothetical protein CK203_093944 [Vitis vinifera]